ncbi:MAG: hypothetical protein KBT45_09115 [Bacteroidales bacterium]|nr:hypothetical protein [Candidatus Colimorpha pelethequi]
MKKLILIALAALSFAACEKEKEEWTVNIESGKFVLLDEPYEHPYEGSTIRAIIFVEENDGVVSPYNITGNVPRWAKRGDTVTVNAVLQEKYPRDQIIVTELSNVSLYEIKKISKK